MEIGLDASGHNKSIVTPDPQVLTLKFYLGPRCATQCRRAAERLEEKNRTDHELHTPDKLTCYLHNSQQALANMPLLA